MKLFRSVPRSNLIHEAHDEAVTMLELGREFFDLVTNLYLENSPKEKLEEIKRKDKIINKIHRSVRRKVYEHLSITGNQDLFASLVLLSVVDDSERIGDYDKNIADVFYLLPRKLDFGQYHAIFDQVIHQTRGLFADTLKAFRDDDEKSAARVLELYGSISDTCDDTIEEIIKDESRDTIEKDLVAFILLMRYLKRVAAHLKNVSSTIINPFHRIGYKAKRQDLERIRNYPDE